MKRNSRRKNAVLVAVLKNKRDLRLLLHERWYRIPLAFLPHRRFSRIAFYQPAVFGRQGKRINYVARIAKRKVFQRIALLPGEAEHPRALDDYVKFTFRSVERLEHPVRNVIPRRVSFGFTTLKRLHSAKNLLALYGVPATEKILAHRLWRAGIQSVSERTVSSHGRRFRIDLVIECKRGAIAIECDNDKAHASKIQKARDRSKDAFLKRLGWRVLRFKEKDILSRPHLCVARVSAVVHSLGGRRSFETF